MLYEIMLHIKNFFPTDVSEEAEYIIKDGTISLPFVLNGAYIRIEGSVLNDGVYQYPVSGLKDETFNGVITMLAIPQDFLKLVKEIEEYDKKDLASLSPYSSESFGGYSYSKFTNGNGGAVNWTNVFKNKLNAWRKL